MEGTVHEEVTVQSRNLFPVVGIGASAGAPEAFKKFVGAIPKNSGAAFVFVQHLDCNYDSGLSELLQKVATIPVVEISNEIKVAPDHIYLVSGNKMLLVTEGVLLLTPRPLKNKGEPNLIDIFFTSLAEVHQSHAVGVVLSGTGSDGTLGLKAIKDFGGITFAQDESSATYSGMPQHAVQAGVVDFILPPEEIPESIQEFARHFSSEGTRPTDDDIFRNILSLLQARRGMDFTHYKQTVIRRRILRRMLLSKQKNIAAYHDYLSENKAEQDLLYQDFLISATAFFRDPKTFVHLCETTLPQLLKSKGEGDTIRIWIAACSTGQEAYSMAICIQEYLTEKIKSSDQKAGYKVQIFATDISEPAIAKARIGWYSKEEVEGVDMERLKNFFTKSDNGYAVSSPLREMCIFANHNFLNDLPFGRMDMISCRNVLIYMEPSLQNKALTTFHYALNPDGVLLLGRAETTGNAAELFVPIDRIEKIFSRNDVPSKVTPPTSPRSEQVLLNSNANSRPGTLRTDFNKIADDILLSRYTPAAVVVNQAMDIVYFRGKTGNYLEQAPGKPSHNLLKMAKSGLGFELRNLIHKLKRLDELSLKENIPIEINGVNRLVNIEAIPLADIVEPHFLILFRDTAPVESNDHPEDDKTKERPDKASAVSYRTSELRIQQLEKELALAREDMRLITEEQETANDELQSSNEELINSSEELQSLNEELETSKEELQASIEELTIVNQEGVTLNELLGVARDYAETIVATIREPLLVLDHFLTIKSANRSFYNSFKVSPAQTEGKSIYELGDHQWDIPDLHYLLEKLLPKNESFFDFEVAHEFQGIGHRTMMLNARAMKGEKENERLILLAFEDITEKKAIESKEKELQRILRQTEEDFRRLADLMPAKISNAKADGEVIYFSKDWLDFAGMSFEDLRDFGYQKIMHPDEVEEFQSRLTQAAATGMTLEMEMRFLNTSGEYIWHLNRASPVKDDNGVVTMWVVVTADISEQIKIRNSNLQEYKKRSHELEEKVLQRTVELRRANESLELKNEELELKNQELNSFTFVSSHDLQEPLRKIQTFVKMLVDHETGHLSAKGLDYFRRIQDAANRMQWLIKDLLAFAQVSKEERIFEEAVLGQIIHDVTKELSEVIEEKKATIEVSGLCSAKIIPFQFRQLLLNLIGNSIKFSRPGVPAHITVESNRVTADENHDRRLKAGREYCHLKVSDNGIGFSAEYGEKIFEMFQQLHPKSVYGGTGIGLSIVKKIVENHNGCIFATSEVDQGATFDIYIPVEPVSELTKELVA